MSLLWRGRVNTMQNLSVPQIMELHSRSFGEHISPAALPHMCPDLGNSWHTVTQVTRNHVFLGVFRDITHCFRRSWSHGYEVSFWCIPSHPRWLKYTAGISKHQAYDRGLLVRVAMALHASSQPASSSECWRKDPGRLHHVIKLQREQTWWCMQTCHSRERQANQGLLWTS